MKPKTYLRAVLLAGISTALLSGCAHFQTKQYDKRVDANGKPGGEIVTKASAWTFFSASSQLQNFKATQSEKTQGASVGSLTQQTDAGTNVAHIIEAVTSAAIKAATGK